LDTRLSPSWVNRELAKLEAMAAVVHEVWQPAMGETLAGGEIYSKIELESGQLRDPVTGAKCLRRIGQQLQNWEGQIYQKLSRNLDSFAGGLFNYQPVLSQALAPLIERWGVRAIQALSRIWQIKADGEEWKVPSER